MFKKRISLRNFPSLPSSCVVTDVNESQQVFIGIDLVLGYGESCLVSPNLEVGIGRLGDDGHSDTRVIRLCRLYFIGRCGVRSSQAAGYIYFPTRRRADRIVPEVPAIGRQSIGNRADRSAEALLLGRGRAIDIEGRKKIRTGAGSNRARLTHPKEALDRSML